MFKKDACVSYQLLFFPEIWGNMFKSTYKYEVLYVFVKSSYFRRFWKWCSRRFRSILTVIFMLWKFEKKLYTHELILITLISILVKKIASGRRELAPPITWLEKNMGYFKTSKFPRFRKFPGNDFTPTYIFRGTLLIPISFFLHKWREPGEFCHGC